MESGGKACIGGMGCRFPQSDNIQEFWDNLESGKDMIGPTRWPVGLYNLPPRSGCIKDLRNFDAEFFGITASTDIDECNQLLRVLLEVIYECIADSGLRMENLQQKKTGLYFAYSFCDSDAVQTSQEIKAKKLNNAASITGSLMSHFGFGGPAGSMDTACSSSFTALNAACRDLQQGRCAYAIVTGTTVLDNPNCSLRFKRLGMLSPTGTSNVFDKSANGYVRSDGVAAILVSRREVDLRRIYATIVDLGVNCDGYKEEGIVFPSSSSQASLLTSVYKNISTNDIAYVEAHGTGTQAGDKSEAKSLASVLCKGRNSPLLVGSVKSNMGHCEVTAGLAGIIKCILVIHHGKIPGNLNFKVPNPEIEELHNGKISVVNKTRPLPEGLIGINSFGFGGVNGHVILKPYKHNNVIKDHDVKLLLLSARTRIAFDNMASFIKNNCNNHCLMDFINHSVIGSEKMNRVRGFIKMDNLKEESIDLPDRKKKLLCYVIDIPWIHITPSLPVQDIQILKKLNNYNDLLKEDASINIDMCLVLVNALNKCKVKSDVVIGSGLGEIVAAFIDGCLDLNQCLLIIEAISESVKESTKVYPFYKLLISVDDAYQLGPKVKVVSVYNKDCVVVMVTAEGKENIDKILKDIHTKGGVYNFIGNHPPLFTSLFQQYTNKLETKLASIITQPKLRSSCYLSGCQQPALNNKNITQDAVDSKYFTRLLTKPCHLYRALSSLSTDTTIVDICSEENCSHSPHQVESQQPDRVHCHTSSFLDTLGFLHITGVVVDLDNINDKCGSLPLDCKTPPISHLIGWDHSVKRSTLKWYQYSCQVKDEQHDEYCFSVDHNSAIESCLIYHVWQAAMLKSKVKEEKSIKISILGGNPHMLYTGSRKTAHVCILPGTKQFIVTACDCKNGNCCHSICGFFELCDDIEMPVIPTYEADVNQNVQKADGADDEVQRTEISWEDNWLEYLDNIIDFSSITSKSDLVRVCIDSKRHGKEVSQCSNIYTMYEPSSGICKSGGVALQFDVTKELVKDRHHLIGHQEQLIPDAFVTELSLCELSRGALCLSYLGTSAEKEATVGIIAIDEGKYGHQSAVLPGDLLHLELFYPYCVAYYIIHDKLKLKEGQSILFLPPLAGINLVMIWMAVGMKCKVFVATDGDNMKSVKELFPDIIMAPLNHAGNIIRKNTHGEGSDACVSFSDPLLTKYLPLDTSINWLADHGQYVIVDNPLSHGTSVGMSVFLRNITLSVCEPIQAIVKLINRTSNEMKVLAAGMLSNDFKKLSTMVYKEFSFPLARSFDFSVPISLHSLVKMAEEPGINLDNLAEGLSPVDIKQLEDIQDILSFIPQEYSLAQDTLDLPGTERFNNAFATCFSQQTDSSSGSLSLCKADVLKSRKSLVLPRVRIISVAGVPHATPKAPQNTPEHQYQTKSIKSTSTPLNIEIHVSASELEESKISLEHSCQGASYNCGSSKCLGRNPPTSHTPSAIARIRSRSKGSSLSSDGDRKSETSSNRPGLNLKLDVAKAKQSSAIDLLLVGPPRTPHTPQITEMLSSRFEPTIVPLNKHAGRGLFIVHPIIGTVSVLKPLAESLNFPIYGIQRTVNTPETSINCIASYYRNSMELFDPEGPYLLAGYSFGGLIALEIAHQLQAKGKKIKHCVLLDGSIDYTKLQVDHLYNQLTQDDKTSPEKEEDKIEVPGLLWFMKLFGPIKQKSLIHKALMALDSQQARIEMAVDFLMGDVVYSPCPRKTKWLTAKHKVLHKTHKQSDGLFTTTQELIRMSREKKARDFVVAMKLADKYEPGVLQVEGDIHLLRIKNDIDCGGVNLDSDYGLSERCTGKVIVTLCDGNHESFLSTEKVAAYLKKLIVK